MKIGGGENGAPDVVGGNEDMVRLGRRCKLPSFEYSAQMADVRLNDGGRSQIKEFTELCAVVNSFASGDG